MAKEDYGSNDINTSEEASGTDISNSNFTEDKNSVEEWKTDLDSEEIVCASSIDDETITVKRRKISVPKEEDVSAISMLTADDFILTSEDAPPITPAETEESEDSSEDIPTVDEKTLPSYEDIYPEIRKDEPKQIDLSDIDDYDSESNTLESEPQKDSIQEEESSPLAEDIIEVEESYTSEDKYDTLTEDTSPEEVDEIFADEIIYAKDEKASEPEVTIPPKRKKKGYDPCHPRAIDTVFDFIEIFVFSLVAVLVFTTFFFKHTMVMGESMEDTLYENEHLIISNLFYTPSRGDIIVCEDYETKLHKPIVKRVIGIAGDRVQISPDGEVKINGEIIDEDYVKIDQPYYTYEPLDVTVPEGEVFVMGDHRNKSTDSRDTVRVGTIDCDTIMGRVILRFYPFDRFGKVE